MRWLLTLGVMVLVAGTFAVACSGGSSGGPSGGEPRATVSSGTTVTVGLKEFAIELDKKSAKVGAVTLKATNKGTTAHELTVIKSDLGPDKLPIKDAKADVTGLTVVGAIPEMATGKANSKTLELAAGQYLMICNIPAHYQAGMAVAFTVQ